MCTVFSDKNDSLFVAKSYDNFVNHGMVYTNKRNCRKKSLVMPGEKVLAWKSAYGSITFSQSGKGMPAGGMNENGLVVEQATLPGTEYGTDETLPRVSCLEAIQYILDTCGTAEEAVKAFTRFTIARDSWKMHYYICDSGGRKAIVEFIDGKTDVYTDEKIRIPLVTNTSYRISLDPEYAGLVDMSNKYQKNSVERNRRVAEVIEKNNSMSVDDYFDILKTVHRVDSVWNCVYDIRGRVIYLRSIYNQEIQRIAFDGFDFSDNAPSWILDLKDTPRGTAFQRYTREKNRENIDEFYGNQIIINMMHMPGSDFIIKRA